MSETNKIVPTDPLSPSDCKGLADVLMNVGDKWTILVVGALSKGQLTLKRLESDGIVTRTLSPSVPPRVDYELTELGMTLRGALVPLHKWAATHKEAISANRQKAGLISDTER